MNVSVYLKIACVSSVDKHTDDKYSVTNFQPISVLNSFSKISEKNCKRLFDDQQAGTSISPFISANQKFYSTEHVLIRDLEDWRYKLNKKNVVGAILTDLSKTFDFIPHYL